MIVFMYIRQREPAKIVSKEWKLTIVFLRGLNVVSPEENGRFRSTKHDGLGTGTASIRSIAERYQGVADFRYEDGIFYASVMLKFDSKISHGNP